MMQGPFEPSPDLRAVERNLQRERRVFSLVIVLLGLLAVAIAFTGVFVRLNRSLRAQEQVARLYEQGVVDAVLERRSTLAASNLILELRANGTLAHSPGSQGGLCTQVWPSAPADDVLQQSCDQSVGTLIAASRRPSIEMISIASGATYRYESPDASASAARPMPPLMPPALITRTILDRFRSRDIDVLQAAREKRVEWLGVPASAAGTDPEMVGASLVAKGDTLYAVVLTRIPLHELLRPAGPNLSIPEPIVFDSLGTPLVAAGARANAQHLDAGLEARPDGIFHWLPDYGWAVRRPPLVADFGHLIFALPIGHQIREMTEELIVIGAITALLVALLFAMYRYWNYRFLTGTYAEAARAQRLLHEARLATEAAARARVAFFASMSHEIRTPLASLLGNMELVAMGPLEPEQRMRVGAMQVSAEGLLQIVNDVLDFSKIDVGALSIEVQPVSVTELLGRIAIAHAPLAAQRRLNFLAVYGSCIPSQLDLDPVRLTQIVNNLLGNAFKFTEAGKIVLRAQWLEGSLEIIIADTGIGIPDAYQDRLFQPFSQVADNRIAQARGTGLGLSICMRLVERMGGRILLDSTLGVGTRVTVRLPLGVSDAVPPPVRPGLPPNRTLVLSREPECIEGLLNHFDWGACQPSACSNLDEPVDADRYDCLLVTEAFDPGHVMAWWPKPASVVWLKQLGPLVATTRPDGGREVSSYSLAGIHAAALAVITGAQPPKGSEEGLVGRPTSPLVGHSVLIAEDNLLNRNLLRDQLGALGARVIVAGNGIEAMAALRRDRMNAVLTDIDMPVMNGFDLLREMRHAGIDIPVYAVSASARPEDVAEGRARGFTGYLTKPVSLAVLASVLARSDDGVGHEDVEQAAATPGDEDLPELPQIPAGYIEAFLAQTEADLDKYDAIRAGRDVTWLAQLLHRIAGSLAVVGPSELAELCEDLRDYAADADGWDDEIELQSAYIAQSLRQLCQCLSAA
ncbi:hybrid sensor histidine kinase/response regulator [Cupriavidus necator]|uniref:histidine kinase n=1 Tax=Cupriavidus necator TaxID=106590 RepID=A0A1U9UXS4_CUPNE|nr:ATP-binding protein [Cupriavidus necator]AQV97369.1 hybrid sensor histidine kinase/response regulator [Cupriavidus necator]